MADPSVLRRGRLDPDALAHLEEERDFLLRSLDDLEREFEAGDVDDHDYRSLKDDYTARAAGVLHAIDEGRAAFAQAAPTSTARRLLVGGAVLAVAVLAGVLVMQSSGRRGAGGLTGLDVASATSRVEQCQQSELDDPGGALACYADVLETLPDSTVALTYRGWLQVREFDLSAGIADLDAAIQLDPSQTAPHLFRAIAHSRQDDARAALADLVTFYDLGPSQTEIDLASGFAPRVAEDALDGCIAADDAGRDPVDVLRCYQQVISVVPDNATALAYQGWLLVRARQLDGGIELLDRAISADPELSAAYVFRAAARLQSGDLDGAATDLDRFDGFPDPPAAQRQAAAQVRAQLDDQDGGAG